METQQRKEGQAETPESVRVGIPGGGDAEVKSQR